MDNHTIFTRQNYARDVTRRLLGPIQPSDYFPLLVLQVSSDKLDEKRPRTAKKDFGVLGQLVEGMGARVVFFLTPLV